MRLGIGEIFVRGAEIQNQEEQTAFFHKHWAPALGKYVQYALEPEFVWDLPAGVPPFKSNQLLDQESNLYAEIRRLYIFMKGSGDHVPTPKKELNFIQLLENVSKEDAQALLHAKDKTLPCGFTAERIAEIYPGLLSEKALSFRTTEVSPTPTAKKSTKKPATKAKAKTAAKSTRKVASTRKPAAKKTTTRATKKA